jgi:hypothetical protein
LDPTASTGALYHTPLPKDKEAAIKALDREILRGKVDPAKREKRVETIKKSWLYRLRGHTLYSKLNFVVTLTQNWRHRKETRWVNILSRFRLGNFLGQDVDYVNEVCYARAKQGIY